MILYYHKISYHNKITYVGGIYLLGGIYFRLINKASLLFQMSRKILGYPFVVGVCMGRYVVRLVLVQLFVLREPS